MALSDFLSELEELRAEFESTIASLREELHQLRRQIEG